MLKQNVALKWTLDQLFCFIFINWFHFDFFINQLFEVSARSRLLNQHGNVAAPVKRSQKVKLKCREQEKKLTQSQAKANILFAWKYSVVSPKSSKLSIICNIRNCEFHHKVWTNMPSSKRLMTCQQRLFYQSSFKECHSTLAAC